MAHGMCEVLFETDRLDLRALFVGACFVRFTTRYFDPRVYTVSVIDEQGRSENDHTTREQRPLSTCVATEIEAKVEANEHQRG